MEKPKRKLSTDSPVFWFYLRKDNICIVISINPAVKLEETCIDWISKYFLRPT